MPNFIYMIKERLAKATKASLIHLGLSLCVVIIAANLIFLLWYPGAFKDMVGGKELFFLVAVVDVICGPLLTLVLFNPSKPRSELRRDLGLVAVIQITALVYGVYTVWVARPLFLVHEFDRFKVIAAFQVEPTALDKLDETLKPKFWQGPIAVGLRKISIEERHKVMLEAVGGGRDYGERPEFYINYKSKTAAEILERAKPLDKFLSKYPEQRLVAFSYAKNADVSLEKIKYLPVMARQDWIALLDTNGAIIGYLKGDGFI